MNFKPNPHGLDHPDFEDADALRSGFVPDPVEYHGIPLWDHPDYDHVGWVKETDLHWGKRITPETVSERPYSGAPVRTVPVFRRKGGAGSIAVAGYDPQQSSEIFYHPDDPNHNAVRLETTAKINHDEEAYEDIEEDEYPEPHAYEVSLYTQDHLGNWSNRHRAGRSSPAAIKDALLAVHLHHDDMPIEINRTTGMAQGNKGYGSKRRTLPLANYAKLMKSCTAEELERYFNEVFG